GAKVRADIAPGQARALAHVAGGAADQVRQSEGGLAIAAVGRAQQREQRGVLCDGQQGAVTNGPAVRCEVESECLDLTEEWFRHDVFFLVSRGHRPRCAWMRVLSDQLGDGKMPSAAMQNCTVSVGIKFSCGALLPPL